MCSNTCSPSSVNCIQRLFSLQEVGHGGNGFLRGGSTRIYPRMQFESTFSVPQSMEKERSRHMLLPSWVRTAMNSTVPGLRLLRSEVEINQASRVAVQRGIIPAGKMPSNAEFCLSCAHVNTQLQSHDYLSAIPRWAARLPAQPADHLDTCSSVTLADKNFSLNIAKNKLTILLPHS